MSGTRSSWIDTLLYRWEKDMYSPTLETYLWGELGDKGWGVRGDHALVTRFKYFVALKY